MSGKSLLESYVIGCEVGFALYYNGGGKNVFPQMKKGFHATSVFGRIAVAAACSKLLGLMKRKRRWPWESQDRWPQALSAISDP